MITMVYFYLAYNFIPAYKKKPEGRQAVNVGSSLVERKIHDTRIKPVWGQTNRGKAKKWQEEKY